jgi:hypothetical protein
MRTSPDVCPTVACNTCAPALPLAARPSDALEIEERVTSEANNAKGSMELSMGNPGRPAGLPKTGGRKKGTPNKATRALIEELAEIGCDPLRELARIAQNEKTPLEFRVRIYSDLLPYLYPKRKPTDDSREEQTIINVNTSLDNSGVNNQGDCSDDRDRRQP